MLLVDAGMMKDVRAAFIPQSVSWKAPVHVKVRWGSEQSREGTHRASMNEPRFGFRSAEILPATAAKSSGH